MACGRVGVEGPVRSSLVCTKRLSGAWGLVREKILRALNWLALGQTVWEKEWGVGLKMQGFGKRKTDRGGAGVNGK